MLEYSLIGEKQVGTGAGLEKPEPARGRGLEAWLDAWKKTSPEKGQGQGAGRRLQKEEGGAKRWCELIFKRRGCNSEVW